MNASTDPTRTHATFSPGCRAGIAICVLASAAALSACDKVIKNTSDTTQPTIELKVRGADGQYTDAATAQLAAASNGQLELMCVVRDADGVKEIELSFSSGTDHCTLPSGAIFDGVFTIKPVPSTLVQNLSGDANNKVLTSLPMLATLKAPLTCDVPGNGTGTPYGSQITVTCNGWNWSSNAAKSTAQKKLVVSLH